MCLAAAVGSGGSGGSARQLCLAVMISKADLTTPSLRRFRHHVGPAPGICLRWACAVARAGAWRLWLLMNSRDKVYMFMSQCRAAATAAARCWLLLLEVRRLLRGGEGSCGRRWLVQ